MLTKTSINNFENLSPFSKYLFWKKHILIFVWVPFLFLKIEKWLLRNIRR